MQARDGEKLAVLKKILAETELKKQDRFITGIENIDTLKIVVALIISLWLLFGC